MRRKNELKEKCMGAVPAEITRIIWVQMVKRPRTDDRTLEATWKLASKFNETLNNFIEVEKYMHILKVEDLEERKYSTQFGDLTRAGKTHFWSNINQQLKDFDYSKITLCKPVPFVDKQVDSCRTRKPATQLKLPAPPLARSRQYEQ